MQLSHLLQYEITGDYSNKPGMRDIAHNDFRPADGSPLIDSGNTSPAHPDNYPFSSPLWPPGKHPFLSSQLSSIDAVENRTADPTIDIGAYEAPCDITGNCIGPPVASFSGTPTRGEVPLLVQFTDTSSYSPTSWKWQFGDGEESIEESPQHMYTSEGKFTVTLTVTNSEGSSSQTKTGYIKTGKYRSTLLLQIPALLSAENNDDG